MLSHSSAATRSRRLPRRRLLSNRGDDLRDDAADRLAFSAQKGIEKSRGADIVIALPELEEYVHAFVEIWPAISTIS